MHGKALREDLKTINNRKKRQKIWGTENTKIDSSPCPSVTGRDGAGGLAGCALPSPESG